MSQQIEKAGYVALVGKPNVGKSVRKLVLPLINRKQPGSA